MSQYDPAADKTCPDAAERTAGWAGRAGARNEVERLRGAIASLPASYRQVIETADLAEQPVVEVAAQMQRTVGAVHMLRARAHDRLRELMRS